MYYSHPDSILLLRVFASSGAPDIAARYDAWECDSARGVVASFDCHLRLPETRHAYRIPARSSNWLPGFEEMHRSKMNRGKSNQVTMATVAAKAGVSKNTVSLALRGDRRIPAITRERIERVASEVGYRKNPIVAHLMSELRKHKEPEYRRTLALLNGHPDPNAFTRHPTIAAWAQGCTRRAEAQGYIFDRFWLHDPELNGSRLARILKYRGIDGAIVLGTFDTNRLPEKFAVLWSKIACVVTGVRTHEPTLSFCCVDHHALMLEAVRQVLALGYRKPALVLSHTVDRLVEGRFSAGMWYGQSSLPSDRRVPAFDKADGSDRCFKAFKQWLERSKPDVLLTLHRDVKGWLDALGYEVPRDIGMVDLEHNPSTHDWAAMEQRNDLSGEAAVDMLISMLHNNELGIPTSPRATLGSSHWVSGVTVRRQA
jgi:LacI family transcriptional regulator